jgi:hypothetical protein
MVIKTRHAATALTAVSRTQWLLKTTSLAPLARRISPPAPPKITATSTSAVPPLQWSPPLAAAAAAAAVMARRTTAACGGQRTALGHFNVGSRIALIRA